MKRTPSRGRRAVPLADLVAWLDRTLDLPAFADDYSNNGLQVEGASRGVAKIACGVDATPAFYAEALRRESVRNVSGATNCCAPRVITTATSAPAFT